jgi:hypothetical protein
MIKTIINLWPDGGKPETFHFMYLLLGALSVAVIGSTVAESPESKNNEKKRRPVVAVFFISQRNLISVPGVGWLVECSEKELSELEKSRLPATTGQTVCANVPLQM